MTWSDLNPLNYLPDFDDVMMKYPSTTIGLLATASSRALVGPKAAAVAGPAFTGSSLAVRTSYNDGKTRADETFHNITDTLVNGPAGRAAGHTLKAAEDAAATAAAALAKVKNLMVPDTGAIGTTLGSAASSAAAGATAMQQTTGYVRIAVFIAGAYVVYKVLR